jgi:penicillin-binding protein 1A
LVDRTSPFDPNVSAGERLDAVVRYASERGERGGEVLDPQTSYMLGEMLRDVVRRGTGVKARSVGREVAGKTGTTNDNTDAWFVGYSARVAAAVWIGYDSPENRLRPGEDGGRAALPLWAGVIRLAEGGRPAIPLGGEPPDGLVRARIDSETGLLARPGAGGGVDLYFREGTAPTEMVGRRSSDDFYGTARDF